jgi:hypothetical protein
MCESGKREERSDELMGDVRRRNTSTAGRGTRENEGEERESGRAERREEREGSQYIIFLHSDHPHIRTRIKLPISLFFFSNNRGGGNPSSYAHTTVVV